MRTPRSPLLVDDPLAGEDERVDGGPLDDPYCHDWERGEDTDEPLETSQ